MVMQGTIQLVLYVFHNTETKGFEMRILFQNVALEEHKCRTWIKASVK